MPANPFRAVVIGLSTSSTAPVGAISSNGYPIVPLSSLLSVANSSINTGAYPIYFPDISANQKPFNLTAAVVSSNTFTIDYTFDYTGSSAFISTAATWFPSTATITSSFLTQVNFSSPVTALRMNITAGSTTEVSTFYAIQT